MVRCNYACAREKKRDSGVFQKILTRFFEL